MLSAITHSALVTMYLCGGTHLSLCLFQFHKGPIAVLWMYEDNWFAMCTGPRLRANDADVVRLQIFHRFVNVAHLESTNNTDCNHLLHHHTGIMSLVTSKTGDLQSAPFCTYCSKSTGMTCASIQLVNSLSSFTLYVFFLQ